MCFFYWKQTENDVEQKETSVFSLKCKPLGNKPTFFSLFSRVFFIPKAIYNTAGNKTFRQDYSGNVNNSINPLIVFYIEKMLF